ncbi:hypothetical protein KZZ52_58745 [Dactylosporangium sp. AC04546]|uniref:hypothetical protein n=1 Tax=Dactylosporangium sp. AC04546 TaxID=2862460 RepID=UPI001EDD54BC|nr:hypothetical protein [Dactylosporangium sp. AC04546]WVK83632.1 hypothetical protein KZZ52_58745 [Dactylosporangium sp. AC04546]
MRTRSIHLPARSRRIAAVALAGLLTAGVLVSTEAPASASIGSCSTNFSNNNDRGYVDAYCTGSAPSSFRAQIKCSNGNTYYGSWRYAGGGTHSYTQCPVNVFWVDYGIQAY